MTRLFLIIALLLLMTATSFSADNSSTMGSYATDFPSLRIWRSGNAYDADGTDFVAGVDFWGRNMARTAGGVSHQHGAGTMFFDSLKIIASGNSRTLITEAYTDFMFFVECGNSQTEDTTDLAVNAIPYNYWFVADSLGLTWTDQFFQLADDSDSVVYPTRYIDASCNESEDGDRKWGNASLSANQKYQFQFGIYNATDDENYPNVDCYYMNYADDTMNYALMKAYAYKRIIQNHTTFTVLDTALDGFTYDNSHPDSWRSPNYIHWPAKGYECWSFGGNTGGSVWSYGPLDIDWVGYDEPFVYYGTNYTTLSNRWHASFNIMLDTMKDMNISTSCNFVNGSPSDVDGYAARHGEVVTTVFFELRAGDMLAKSYVDITASTGPNAELSRVDSAQLYNIPHVNEYRNWGLAADDTGNSYHAHTYLCAHLTYQDTSLTYFCFQNDDNGSTNDGDTMYLANWDLFKRNFGNVLNNRQLYTTGTTVDGDAVNVFWREYDSAFVYWFPPYNTTDDSALTNYVEIDCGEPVYELGRTNPGHCDSTYRSDGNIRISPWRGVVAWKIVSGDPPPSISNIAPTSSYKDSTDAVSATVEDNTELDSIFNYVWHPDSISGTHDSISIWDTGFTTAVTSYSTGHNYTWPDSGSYWIVFAALDNNSAWTRDSISMLADVEHNPPTISNILPALAYKDSTDNISADITDNAGVDSVWSYIWPPDSTPGVNDSVPIADSVLSPVSASFTYTHAHTWADSGNYWLVFVAKDEEVSETRDSQQILVSVQGVAESEIIFADSTGMIDTYGAGPPNDTNQNNGTLIYLYNSEAYYHTFVGDYSIDDSLNDAWTIDSFWFVWNCEDLAWYSASDVTYMYLVALDDDRDWVEGELTWLNWNDLNQWTNPGGDYGGCISDTTIITDTTMAKNQIDTITIHRGTEAGETWLDSCKYSTGNFGFMILNKCVTCDNNGQELVYMRSTEHATASYRPWMKAFPHSSPITDLGVFIIKGVSALRGAILK